MKVVIIFVPLKNKKMENLTTKQQAEVKVLVRLGDTLELAIATVLAEKELDSDLYNLAYNS